MWSTVCDNQYKCTHEMKGNILAMYCVVQQLVNLFAPCLARICSIYPLLCLPDDTVVFYGYPSIQVNLQRFQKSFTPIFRQSPFATRIKRKRLKKKFLAQWTSLWTSHYQIYVFIFKMLALTKGDASFMVSKLLFFPWNSNSWSSIRNNIDK